MERIKNIIENKKYIKCLKKNEREEKNRIYCKHQIEHFVDTARIAYIVSLEKNLNINKEYIYAAALLHEFLNKANPRIAVISCGINNDFGHPHKPTLAKLQSKKIKTYRTDKDGTIILISDGNKISKE